MSESDSTVRLVPDKLSEKTGLVAKFVNNETISLHSFLPHLKYSKDTPSKFANTDPANIFHISENFILDDEIVRSLVAESSSIFYNLQTYKDKSNDVFLQTSRIYRSAIRSTLNKLEEAALYDGADEEEVQKYENYITIFYSIECLWHLCEFLLIDRSTNSIVPNLLEWTKFHFPTPGQSAIEMLMHNKDRDLEFRSSYWNTVKGLILQGQVEIVRTLLKLNSSSGTMTFQLAEKELQTMPVFSSHGGLSLQKFRSQWQFWSTSLQSKIDSGLFSSEPELETIMKLITGDNQAWFNACKESQSWYECFAGFLFYTQPAVRYFELGTFADNWLSNWALGREGGGGLKPLDRMVLAVLKNDMTDLIHSIQDFGDNKWFVVHLVDLLVHCDQLRISDESNFPSVITLRENLIYDYGVMLMSRGSLWEIGMDYLQFSCGEGIGAREVLLSRIPFRNDAQAMKMIGVARKYGMNSVEQEICRVMTQRSLRLTNYGNALEWAIRSKDNIYVTKVANIFLHHYCNTGEMLHRDLLANIGAKMFSAPRLLFLVKYFDFHRFYGARSFSQAAELLVNLLDSKIIPEFIWPSLMADTIPLLEHREPIIPTKETFVIMHHLESDLIPYVEKMKKERDSNEKDMSELNILTACPDDLISVLRLACARNLSRAMIIENTLVR